jgi:phosphoribosylamine--glycine ligase
MGAYCDSRILTEFQSREIMDRIIRPAIDATCFTGFLYAGLMMTSDGPKVLEFNVRLGDPETQPLMHRLKSDFASVLMAAARAEMERVRLDWDPGPSVCVVLASAGYPGEYATGIPIYGVEEAGETVFHAGTRIGPRGLETAGGRVLGVTASGEDLATAIDRTYAAARKIRFEGMHYRTDIGRKGLKRYNVGVPGT